MQGIRHHRLIFPLDLLRRTLTRAIDSVDHAAELPLGLAESGKDHEWLVAPDWHDAPRRLRLVRTDHLIAPTRMMQRTGVLWMVGRHGATLGAVAMGSDEPEPLHEIRFVGPGMHLARLDQSGNLSADADLPAAGALSRTVSALGASAWARLVNLRFGLIGASRNGSMILRSLLQLGVREVTLVDSAKLEMHHLGEMDDALTAGHLGQHKVDALASVMAQRYPEARLNTVAESVTHVRALEALRKCDFLISACDHDSARLAGSCLAALYSKPLLDVATGIPRDEAQQPGVSVRLCLPGSCLLCMGGLPRAQEARNVLRSAAIEVEFRQSRDWHERAGSLASLNRIATGLACRMIEDLVAERVARSTWLQLQFDGSGHVQTDYPLERRGSESVVNSNCPICSALLGRGDEGVPLVPAILHRGGSEIDQALTTS